MEIVISKSFYQAFGYFLRSLRYPHIHFSIEGLPLPGFLLNNRHFVPTEKNELFEKWLSPFLLLTALFSFIYHWIRLRGDIDFIYNWLLDKKEAIESLSNEISKYTKFKWNRDKVFIHPVVGMWGGEKDGRVYIGIRPIEYIDNPTLDLVIHELIHVNTPNDLDKELKGSVSNFIESRELATVILTRKIQKEVLKELEDNLQGIPIPLQGVVDEEKLVEFEKSINHIESFSSLLIYVDQLLRKIKRDSELLSYF